MRPRITGRLNIEVLEKFMRSRGDREFVNEQVKKSILNLIFDLKVPSEISKLFQLQIRVQSKLRSACGFSSMFTKLFFGEEQGLNLAECLNFFFKNTYYFREVNDISYIITGSIAQKLRKKIQMYFLHILNSIGLYAFLVLCHLDEQDQQSQLQRVQQSIARYSNFDDENLVIWKLVKELNSKRLPFDMFAFSAGDFFAKFIAKFQSEKCDLLFEGEDNKDLMEEVSEDDEDEDQENRDRLRLKSRISRRIARKLKRFKGLSSRIREICGSRWESLFLVRDFCYKLGYSQERVLRVKEDNLNSSFSNQKSLKLSERFESRSPPTESSSRTRFVDWLRKLNEPGGLGLALFLAHTLTRKCDEKASAKVVTRILFGVCLHKQKFLQLFRVLDAFCLENRFLASLFGFIAEADCLDADSLFVKNGLEHLVIAFVLMHIDWVAAELSVSQFTGFLKSFLALLKDYNSRSYKFEYLISQTSHESQSSQDQAFRTFSQLKETLRTHKKLYKSLEIWLCVLDYAQHIGKQAQTKSTKSGKRVAQSIKTLISFGPSLDLFCYWILTLRSYREVFDSNAHAIPNKVEPRESNQKTPEQTLYQKLHSGNSSALYMLDEFRRTALEVLIQAFDKFGINSIYYFEHLSLYQKLKMNQIYTFNSRKTGTSSEQREQRIDITEMIKEVAQSVTDKLHIKKLLYERVVKSYQESRKKTNNMSHNQRKIIVNMTILLSQADRDKAEFLGQLIAFITQKKAEEFDEEDNELDFDEANETDIDSLFEHYSDSEHVRAALHRFERDFDEENGELFKKQFKAVLKTSQSDRMTLGKFKHGILKEMQSSRSQLDKFSQSALNRNATMANIDLGERLGKSQPTEQLSNVSIHELIELYVELVQGKERLSQLTASDLDRVLKILVELRSRFSSFIRENLGENFRDFSRLKLEKGRREMKVFDWLEKWKTGEQNSILRLTR